MACPAAYRTPSCLYTRCMRLEAIHRRSLACISAPFWAVDWSFAPGALPVRRCTNAGKRSARRLMGLNAVHSHGSGSKELSRAAPNNDYDVDAAENGASSGGWSIGSVTSRGGAESPPAAWERVSSRTGLPRRSKGMNDLGAAAASPSRQQQQRPAQPFPLPQRSEKPVDQRCHQRPWSGRQLEPEAAAGAAQLEPQQSYPNRRHPQHHQHHNQQQRRQRQSRSNEQHQQHEQHQHQRQHQQHQQHRAASGPDALMQAIMHATSVRELRTAVQAELKAAGTAGGSVGPSATMLSSSSPSSAATAFLGGAHIRMRPIHISAAIVRLSKLPHSSGASGADAIAPSACSSSAASGPPHPTSPAAAGGTASTVELAGATDPRVTIAPECERAQLLRVLLDLACAHAAGLTARQLVNVLWALGRLAADGPPPAAAGATADVSSVRSSSAAAAPTAAHLETLVSELLGQQLTLHRWAEGNNPAAAEVQVGMESEDGEWDMAQLGSLRAAPEPSGEAGLQERSNRREPPGEAPPPPPRPCKLDQASNRELANFAWAAAALRLSPPPVWAAVCRLAAARLRGRARQAAGAAGAAAAAAASGDGDDGKGFNPADLSNLSWSLARAGQRPGHELGEGLVRASLARMQEFGAVSLAGLVWGLGTLAAACPMMPPPLHAAPVAVGPLPPVRRAGGSGSSADSGGSSGGDHGWATDPDLLPLLLQRAAPKVVAELAARRMRPPEVVSVTVGLAAAARRHGAVAAAPALVQALADHVASNAAAFVTCRDDSSSMASYGSGVAVRQVDHLAGMLLALVRCVEGADGCHQGTDPRVARRVERALQAAAKQVIGNLPRMSPESLTALAVAYANKATYSGRGGGSAASAGGAAAPASAAPADGGFVTFAGVGLRLPAPASADGAAVPPIRAVVLRATLRAALRLLPGLVSAQPPFDRAASVSRHGGGATTAGRTSSAAGVRGRVRAVVGVMWWCTRGLGSGEEGVAEELRQAAPWLERVLPLCYPSDMAILAATYARAGCHPPSLMPSLYSAARAAAPYMSPLDVSQLVAAAAAAATSSAHGGGSAVATAVGSDALLLSVLEQRCTELLRGGAWPPGQELAVALWAFAKLNHYSEPLLDAAAEVLHSAAAAAAAAVPSSSDLAAELGGVLGRRGGVPPPSPPPLPLLPQEVAMVAAAVGQLRYFDARLMRLLGTQIEADIGRYSARTLTWSLSAFATLNAHHPGLLRAATARVRQLLLLPPPPLAPPPHPESQQQQQRLQRPPQTQLDDRNLSATCTLNPAFDIPEALSLEARTLVNGSGDDGDDGNSGGGVEGMAPPTAFDAVALLWSFGVLQHLDLECLRGLIGVLPRDPRVYSVSDLSRLGLAEAMLRGALLARNCRRLRGSAAAAAAASGADAPLKDDDGSGGAGSGGGGAGNGESPGGGREAALELPVELRSAVASAARCQRGRVSGLQREVAAALRRMGLSPRLEVHMDVFTLDVRLDLPPEWRGPGREEGQGEEQDQQRGGHKRKRAVSQQKQQEGKWLEQQEHRGGRQRRRGDGGSSGMAAAPSKRPLVQIAVEVDGPSHFCANVPNHALGSTVARDRCLQLLGGLQLVAVPHFEWDMLQTPDARQSYLARRLAAAVAAAEAAEPPSATSGVSGSTRRVVFGGGSRRGAPSAQPLFPAMTITTHVVRRSAPPAASAATVAVLAAESAAAGGEPEARGREA